MVGRVITTNVTLIAISDGYGSMDTLNLRNWLGLPNDLEIKPGVRIQLLETGCGIWTAGDQCYVAILNDSNEYNIHRDTYYMNNEVAKTLGLID